MNVSWYLESLCSVLICCTKNQISKKNRLSIWLLEFWVLFLHLLKPIFLCLNNCDFWICAFYRKVYNHVNLHGEKGWLHFSKNGKISGIKLTKDSRKNGFSQFLGFCAIHNILLFYFYCLTLGLWVSLWTTLGIVCLEKTTSLPY